MSQYKNDHLGCVLKSHNIKLEEGTLLDNYRAKRDKVQKALKEEYGSDIIKILHSGSYAKHTAINVKFDMDLCVHFKKERFKTLKEMYDSVFDFLNNKYKKDDIDLIKVRRQKVSCGLTFRVDAEDILFDVTAGREYNDDKEDNDINLYMNTDDANSKKTNIKKHIEHIEGKSKERECIKLLKVWKFHHFHIKSFLIELLTIKAFDKQNIDNYSEKWDRLRKVIEFIRDNIETIELEDPANSNNIVTDSLSKEDKTNLKNELKEMLEKIDKDESKIKYYFPVNDKYPCEKEGYDQNSKKAPSILNTQKFGSSWKFTLAISILSLISNLTQR